MNPPAPETGLVIRYAYLWRDEALQGHEEGVKDRPCAVVLAVKRNGDGTTVLVAPITHTPPDPDNNAIEMPLQTAKRLGLDDQRCWIITHELNSFLWPGPDLRLVERRDPAKGFAFGFLPGALSKKLVEAVRNHVRRGRLQRTGRQ